MKKDNQKSAAHLFRVYLTCAIVFLSLAVFCFIFVILLGTLIFIHPSFASYPVHWVSSHVSLVLLVVFLLLAFLFYWLLGKIRAEQATSSSNFAKPTLIYSTSLFLKTVKRLSGAKGKRGGEGIIACLNVKGLNGDILNFYGAEEVKAINSVVYDCINARFTDYSRYRFGFSLLNSFFIYSKSVDGEGFESQLRELSEDIVRRVAARGKIPSLTILYGACALKDAASPEEALNHAAFASKYNSMNRFSSAIVNFSRDQMSVSSDERELPADILLAIKEEQFQIFYQPKFSLHTNRFYGAEALVRWNHPTRGLLPPSFFIPFSERTGLIVDLDHYIYEHSLRDLSKWESEGERMVKLSINLSRRTVYDEGLLEFLSSQAERYGVEHKYIEIELTESLAARDTAFLFQLVSKIKEMRMQTSIDDFGVGYSSFNSLKKLPFDTLKIDKSFIDDIEVDKKSRDIVRAIISLAHSLGIWTIAEGVETERQVSLLRSMELDAVQGYYYSRPLNAFEFQRFLKNNPFEAPKEKGEQK